MHSESGFSHCFHRNQLISIAGKFPKNADIQVWDEAAFHKTYTKQITDPLGVFCIILVSLYSFYPFRIGNNDPDTTFFKDIEYRNPILSCGFHADIQAAVFQQPVCKAVQV